MAWGAAGAGSGGPRGEPGCHGPSLRGVPAQKPASEIPSDKLKIASATVTRTAKPPVQRLAAGGTGALILKRSWVFVLTGAPGVGRGEEPSARSLSSLCRWCPESLLSLSLGNYVVMMDCRGHSRGPACVLPAPLSCQPPCQSRILFPSLPARSGAFSGLTWVPCKPGGPGGTLQQREPTGSCSPAGPQADNPRPASHSSCSVAEPHGPGGHRPAGRAFPPSRGHSSRSPRPFPGSRHQVGHLHTCRIQSAFSEATRPGPPFPGRCLILMEIRNFAGEANFSSQAPGNPILYFELLELVERGGSVLFLTMLCKDATCVQRVSSPSDSTATSVGLGESASPHAYWGLFSLGG